MYENSSSTIRTDLGITRNISIRRGVKQGDLPFAVLFCLILHAILSETFHQLNYGIKLGGENITDKGYADDFGLMTESVEQMNIVLNRLYIIAKRYGMSISIKKAKVMFIGKHNQDAVSTPVVCINNVPVEVVTKFEYLGSILTNTGDDTPARFFWMWLGCLQQGQRHNLQSPHLHGYQTENVWNMHPSKYFVCRRNYHMETPAHPSHNCFSKSYNAVHVQQTSNWQDTNHRFNRDDRCALYYKSCEKTKIKLVWSH